MIDLREKYGPDYYKLIRSKVKAKTGFKSSEEARAAANRMWELKRQKQKKAKRGIRPVVE